MERALRIHRFGRKLVRWMPRQHEPLPLPDVDREVRDRRKILTPYLNVSPKVQRIRTSDDVQTLSVAPHPRHRPTVIEAHDEPHAHIDGTADAFDNADEFAEVGMWRHAINHPHHARVGR